MALPKEIPQVKPKEIERQKGREKSNILEFPGKGKEIQDQQKKEITKDVDTIYDEIASQEDVIKNIIPTHQSVDVGTAGRLPGSLGKERDEKRGDKDNNGSDGTGKEKKRVWKYIIAGVVAAGIAVTSAWMGITDQFDKLFGNKDKADIPADNKIETPVDPEGNGGDVNVVVPGNDTEETQGSEPVKTPEQTEETPDYVESEVVEEEELMKGTLPEFSNERNAEWGEKTKENIINFLENGYSQDDESLICFTEDDENKELGIMGVGDSPLDGSARCQVYLLGGETRDGRWCVYLGSEDKEGNRFVFPAQFDWIGNGIYTYVFDKDNYMEAMGGSVDQVLIDQSNIESFDNILNDHLGKAMIVSLSYGMVADFDSFIGMIGEIDGVNMNDFYKNWTECSNTGDEILNTMNVVNKSSVSSLEEKLLKTFNGMEDDDLVPIINSASNVDLLFDNYSSGSFLFIQGYDYRG